MLINKDKSFWVPLFFSKRRRFLKLFEKSFTRNFFWSAGYAVGASAAQSGRPPLPKM
ncbi:hypothetical protein SXCC_04512 [Gluconacetobacter sp. SXCC-1]|nr:hypothetical protein SXCC_04512 [Gluconacetobacter sp. SXCC-1]